MSEAVRFKQLGLGIGGMPTYDHKAILTPPELYAKLDAEFHFDFDPCPYPRPEGFDGLKVPWGRSNWCNPIFWKDERDPAHGHAAWAKKAIRESALGKLTVLAFPLNSWEAELLSHIDCQDIRVPKDWYWIRPDGKPARLGRPVILWVVRPKGDRQEGSQ